MNKDKSWELPNPFIKPEGTLINGVQEWDAQREYLKKILEDKFYGTMPPRPEYLTSETLTRLAIWENSAIYEKVRIYTGPAGEIAYNVHVFRPNSKGLSVPVIIPCAAFLREEIAKMAVEQNFSVLCFEYDEAAPDDPVKWNQGSCAKAYPEYSWRTLAMWAWLQSRVIDWLETQNFADLERVVVTGHSRFGKAAVCCGIYDERAAIVAPAGSGCGGLASMRLGGSRFGEDIGSYERIGYMLRRDRFAYWLLPEMAEYGSEDGLEHYRENEIPFDSNTLGACIAPRGLILLEALDDAWVSAYGTQTAWLAAAEVYQFLGALDKCAIHYREGGHDYNREDWSVMLDFCKVQLYGEPKQSNYKIVYKNQLKSGYSWRCPEGSPEPEEEKMHFNIQKWSFL